MSGPRMLDRRGFLAAGIGAAQAAIAGCGRDSGDGAGRPSRRPNIL